MTDADLPEGAVALCARDAVADGAARSFVVGEGAGRRDIIVVASGRTVSGYLNSCPHRGTPLETFPDRFLDSAGFLVCSTHGARFRPADGFCVAGPCAGQFLRTVKLAVREGTIFVLD
jgi:nitrite reductase/ring-hydroxylating ferredoxin subunit